MTAAALPPRIPGQPAPAAVIAEIRRLHGEGLSSRKIGALLGMDRGAVRRWALHPDPFRPPRTKLSLEQAREIRRLKAEGKSYKSLSDLFGVSQGMIGHVLSGHAWREPGGRP
jgi:predicted transcriptional regulator